MLSILFFSPQARQSLQQRRNDDIQVQICLATINYDSRTVQVLFIRPSHPLNIHVLAAFSFVVIYYSFRNCIQVLRRHREELQGTGGWGWWR